MAIATSSPVPVLEISELYSMLKCRWRVTSTRHVVFVITISRMSLLSGHARLVVRCDRRDHITPVLKKLHWLPVKQRVTYKILLLTFRALNGLAPIYIVDMLHRHRPARALRSANNNDLLCHQRVIVTVIEHSLSRPRVYGMPFRMN